MYEIEKKISNEISGREVKDTTFNGGGGTYK